MFSAKKAWLIAAALLLFVVITGAVVINAALSTSSSPVSDKVISLNVNAAAYDEAKAENSEENKTALTQETTSEKAESGSSAELSGFTVSDSEKNWSTNTTVNIFEHGDDAVSADGTGSANRTIAPGTENTYVFTLSNDAEHAVKYYLDISGGNDSEYEIPVKVEVLDSEGNSVSGEMKSIKDFNSVSASGNISAYSSEQYQIHWKWVFENGTDSYDTSLGDKAVEEEIACHMNINVVAEYDYTAESGGESSVESAVVSDGSAVKTGDNGNTLVYISATLTALAVVAAVVFRKRRSGASRDD